MEVDIVKTSASDSSSLDTMAMMMMPTEKFPKFCEPFCNTTLTTYQENEFSGRSSSSTTAVPIFNVAPPCLIDPPPSNVNLPIQQQQQPPPLVTTPLQQPNFVNPSGRFRNPNNSFLYAPSSSSEKRSSMAAMREMIFQIAVMQPIHIDPESIKPQKRRNVKISKDPQSVAARHRRERIGERIRILQRLVPGGTKMDTASMLDEAVHYVKFLKKQVQTLEQAGASRPLGGGDGGIFPGGMSGANFKDSALLMKGCQQPCHMVGYSSKQLLSRGVIN